MCEILGTPVGFSLFVGNEMMVFYQNYVSRTINYQISQVVLRVINISLFQMKITLQNVTRENEAVIN